MRSKPPSRDELTRGKRFVADGDLESVQVERGESTGHRFEDSQSILEVVRRKSDNTFWEVAYSIYSDGTLSGIHRIYQVKKDDIVSPKKNNYVPV
jgi:hypothetical protein